MDAVHRQYEAYPYPARAPEDEARRLVTGSPSHPVEIDHFLFRGRRDWTAPFRALVAGGGTGDATIMLAQLLQDRGTPAEIHYLDLSTASRRIAEARAEARGLSNITFRTGDLRDAPALAAEVGPFDYIDCCGVLHHLPDPQEGFDALAEAVAPEGGVGIMVYAPYGRVGVYEMQGALAALCGDAEPAEQVALARRLVADAPPTNGLVRNAMVGDHLAGDDAGFYDLLLHSQDTPFDVRRVMDSLSQAGLALAGFVEPARYDPRTYVRDAEILARLKQLDSAEQAAFCERLAGNMKVHVFYARRADQSETVARPTTPDAIPVLHRLEPNALAEAIRARGRLRFTIDGITLERRIDKSLAGLAAKIDGRTALGALQAASGLDWLQFSQRFGALYAPLDGFNALRLSGFSAVERP